MTACNVNAVINRLFTEYEEECCLAVVYGVYLITRII